MSLFKKIPYHFPQFGRLGEWEWDSESGNWTLHLTRRSRFYLQLHETMDFYRFDDDRINYQHICGFSDYREDYVAAWITVKGEDGREYFWNQVSEYWRSSMNAGKRCHPQSDYPFPVSNLRTWTESSKAFYED